MSTTTDLRADGSFQRSVTYTINDASNFGSATKKQPVEFHHLFGLPQKAPATTWTTTHDKEERHLTLVSKVPAGSDSPADIQLLSQAGKPILSSRAQVQKLSDGNLLYEEDISWLGPEKPLSEDSSAEIAKAIRDSLPDRLRSDAGVDALMKKSVPQLLGFFFGPPEIGMGEALSNPDAFKVRIAGRFSEILTVNLKEAFPSISDAELDKTVRKINALDLTGLKATEIKSKAGHGESEDLSEITPLLFVVTYPGRLVETDGLTAGPGKVYWSLTPREQFSIPLTSV